MEAYAAVLAYAIPGFFLLIIAEAWAASREKVKVNQDLDTISSLSSGITNTIKNILGLSLIIVSYDWMVDHFAIWDWQAHWLVYVIAFLGIDFAAYWSHRFNHEINLLWNRHIVHHSSEEFNLSCALRQPISNVISIYFFLYIPLAIIGVPAQVIAVLAPLHLFAQFWYHTRLIDRMGWLEYIIVTPSHHRVHHAINDEYIDKNYAAIFILWDKWFGTFQEEKKDTPPVFGTKTPVNTWNPVIINFMHLWGLIKDAWNTRYWKDKFLVWIKPTGWRPRDLRTEEKPIDVYERPKYQGMNTQTVRWYAWTQLTAHNLILIWAMLEISSFTYGGLLGMGLYLFFGVFAYTSVMDGHRIAVPSECAKFVLGIAYIYFGGIHSWPLNSALGNVLLTAYTLLSLVASLYLSNQIASGRSDQKDKRIVSASS